jgi:hypothetical protein
MSQQERESSARDVDKEEEKCSGRTRARGLVYGRQQTADSRQQTTNSRQQTADR